MENIRAKEYIVYHSEEIKHIDIIRKIISDLLPLRNNKTQTDQYYTEILESDVRRKVYLMQKDLYDQKNAMQQEEPKLIFYDNEVPYEEAAEIRNELFSVIRGDKSFGYLFFQLGNEQNAKLKGEPIDCIPNKKVIMTAICNNRDDYPKTSLDDYLDDDFNYAQNEILLKSGFSETDTNDILSIFNLAYQIYDEIRCKKSKISEVRAYLKEEQSQYIERKSILGYALVIVTNLIKEFSSNDSTMDRVSNEMSKVQFNIGINIPTADIIEPSIQLNSSRGLKLNFIRVINILCELGFFCNSSIQTSATKKSVFTAFGKLLDCNLTDFQKQLSTAKMSAKADNKSQLKIFDDMLAKQREIINEKE